MFNSIQYYDMLRLFAVTTQTQLSAPTVPPRSDTISRAAVSARNSLAPRPMTSIQFRASIQFQAMQVGSDEYMHVRALGKCTR